MAEFEPLHAHSSYSLLDRHDNVAAISSPTELVKKAKELNYSKLALTDSANFFGLYEFAQSCRQEQISPIFGVELPIDTVFYSPPICATLVARDLKGLITLFSWTTQFARDKKMVTLDQVIQGNGQFYVFVSGPFDRTRDLLLQDNFFYGLDRPQTKFFYEANKAEGTDKLVVTHDIRAADMANLGILAWFNRIAVERAKGERFTKERHRLINNSQTPLSDSILKTPQQIAEDYQLFPAAISRAGEIAHSIPTIELLKGPDVKAKSVPKDMTAEQYLFQLVWQTATNFNLDEKLKQRVQRELEIINKFNFANYLLICFEAARYFQEKEIPYIVTGSGNNSFILFLLGISGVDSRDLDFRRFMNEERDDLPDVDFYVAYGRRSEASEFFLNYYEGATKIAVANMLHEAGIDELAKRYHLPMNPATRAEIAKLKLPRNVSTHPTATVIAPPLAIQLSGNSQVAQIDKYMVEQERMHKYDVVSSTLLERKARIRSFHKADGLEVTVARNDAETLNNFFLKDILGNGIDSPHILNIKKSWPRSAASEDTLTRILAAARPAGARWRNQTSPLSEVDELKPLGRTNFTILFQDQLLEICDILGLPLSIGNKLRKINELPDEEQTKILDLMEQAVAVKKYPAEAAVELRAQVMKFRSYGFVEGHAKALGSLVYDLSFFNTHYPDYYWGAVLSTLPEKVHYYPTQAYVNAALRDGIQFHFPGVDKLPELPETTNRQLVFGKKLLPLGEFYPLDRAMQDYSEFLRKKEAGAKPAELVAFQMEKWKRSFTDNPLVLFPNYPKFDPEKAEQTIIGQVLIISRRLSEPDGDFVYVTFDSNGILSAKLMVSLAARKANSQARFWHFRLGSDKFDRRIVDIFPPL